MTIPFPPNRDILLPLRSDRLEFFFDEEKSRSEPFHGTRRFELYREQYGQTAYPSGTAQYVEVAK